MALKCVLPLNYLFFPVILTQGSLWFGMDHARREKKVEADSKWASWTWTVMTQSSEAEPKPNKIQHRCQERGFGEESRSLGQDGGF